jgi:hypothetical protein
MALVKIEGTITRTLGENGLVGFWLDETVTNSLTGQSWPVKWTVWSKTFGAKVGDIVEVRGELSLKSKAGQDDQGNIMRKPITNEVVTYIDRNINDPEIKVLRAAPIPNQTDSWGNTLPDVAPF